MLPISGEYHGAIRQERYRRLQARVEITWTDPSIDASIQVTANSEANICWPGQTADSIEELTFKYAALDGFCMLDDTFHPAPDTEALAGKFQMGYWSGKLSLANGLFDAPNPRITVRFIPRSMLALKVVGDTKREEWPVDFEIRLYDAAGLVYTESVSGNTEVHWEKNIADRELYDITRMELEIIRWSHPGRHAKIAEFYSNVLHLYEGDDVVLLSLLEERETSEGSLPIGNITSNELDIRLVNRDDRFNVGNSYSQYHQLMKPNRKIRAWIGPVLPSGIVEYQPLGTFWTQGWSVPEKSLYASTTGWDRLAQLENSTYNCEVYQDTNLYDRAVHILEDAGVRIGEYFVDPELQGHVIPWFWLEACSHREALRRVVERCLGQAYTDRKGIIRVEGPGFIKMPE